MSLKAIAIAWACAVLTQGVAADFDSCTNLLPRWDGSAWVFRRSFCINEAYDMWIVTALNLSQYVVLYTMFLHFVPHETGLHDLTRSLIGAIPLTTARSSRPQTRPRGLMLVWIATSACRVSCTAAARQTMGL